MELECNEGWIAIAKTKRFGIQDVAKAAGVSPSAVSAVLNNNYEKIRISPKTREKVLNAAKELNYTTNLYARKLATSATDGSLPTICIFWESERYHLSLRSFLEGINRYIESTGHEFDYIVCPYDIGKLRKRERHIITGPYHGLIFVGLTDSDQDYLQTLHISVPHVYVNRVPPGANAVIVDNYVMGDMAASCILKHHPASMAQISPHDLSERSESIRRAGFFSQCERAGLSQANLHSIAADDSAEGGYAAAQQLFSRNPSLPCGLFVTSDTALVGIMRYISEHGLGIPEDVLIVAYCDIAPNVFSATTLTTISSPVPQMSYDCMLVIDHMLRGEALEGNIKAHQPLLVYGDSTPRVPG